nr:hypothetical protein [Tanacetum cinerariifolium]
MKGVVAAAVVTAGVVVAAGWRGDGAAREGEWRGGSDRSGDRESFWVRRKKPAGKVFRRRQQYFATVIAKEFLLLSCLVAPAEEFALLDEDKDHSQSKTHYSQSKTCVSYSWNVSCDLGELCTRIDKSILRLFGYFTVSFHLIVIPLDHQRKNTENLNTKITKLNEELSDCENTLYHYKIGLSQVEARLVEFKIQEIKFCEKIRGLERDVETGLPEFLDDTITDYSRPTPSIDSSKSNTSDLQNSNSSISEHEESSSSIMSKPMIKFVKAADCPG